MANDRPITMHEAALRAGTLMGLYWIIKFTFIPLGFSIPILQLLFMAFTLFVPVLGYIYTRRYRDRQLAGAITYGAALRFCSLMYLAATMLAFIAHYVYFEYMDDGFIVASYQEMFKLAKDQLSGDDPGNMLQLFEQSEEAFEQLSEASALEITTALAWYDVWWCFILSLITGLVTMRRRKTEQ